MCLSIFCLFSPASPAPLAEKTVQTVKRQPVGPRDGFTLMPPKVETITAIPYDIIKEGVRV
jgi:hypothetical protein